MITELQSINVSNNNLTSIDFDLFKFNTKLKFITLAYNYIKDFNLNLTYLNVLKYLDIENNNIKTFQEHMLISYLNKEKTSIHIDNNNISCDCSMNWMRQSAFIGKISITLKNKCTLNVHKNVRVRCFIYKDACGDTIINEKLCILGKLTNIKLLISL